MAEGMLVFFDCFRFS